MYKSKCVYKYIGIYNFLNINTAINIQATGFILCIANMDMMQRTWKQKCIAHSI